MRGRKEKELVPQEPADNGLGTALRAWRRVRGLSVTELAIEAGLGPNGRGYISRIEHGQIRHLGEERLGRIAAALHLERADLLLHRLPEREHTPASNLDHAIVGGQALLRTCAPQSFDWARIHLLLARLYCERAAATPATAAKYSALVEAQSCIECALRVFTASTAPRSFQEATQVSREIHAVLEAPVLAGSLAFLKRCPPRSLDWARVQLLRATLYRDRALLAQGQAAQTALAAAQRCLDAAFPVFTRKQAQHSLQEAHHLRQDIEKLRAQMDTP